jgi:uncharacterized 2Fe-2S/4Fe-4S cluster protein (DUF4445 family)
LKESIYGGIQLENKQHILSETGAVFLTQKDVRQVQLAKGAIAAAIDLLLKELDLHHTDIDQVLVAGAFGYT